MERVFAKRPDHAKCRYECHGLICCHRLPEHLELGPGQPKLKPNDITHELSQEWSKMDAETKAELTNPLIEELRLAQEEADTKPRIMPVHVLNDVSATVAKIKREVRLSSSMDVSCS